MKLGSSLPNRHSSAERTFADNLPTDWPKLRAKYLFRERQDRSDDGSEELLSASHITGITKRSDKDVGMFLAETTEGYKVVKKDDAVINTMWAWMGAMGVSPIDGIISPSYGVYTPTTNTLESRYCDYLMRSLPFVAEVNRRSKGVWSSRLRLYSDEFLDMLLPIPTMPVQNAIADLLDRETARIDELIKKKRLLLGLIRPKWEAMIHDALHSADTKHLRFGVVAKRKLNPINRMDDESYTPLGLFNRGRGVFKKPLTTGVDLGDSLFFWIEEDDLILSGQFAWEGAVAYAGANEAGCIVSHRYPVYRATEGVKTKYLFAYLRTEAGQFLLSESSKGSAGRNRPLNSSLLEKETIPIPSAPVQAAIAELVDYENQLSWRIGNSIACLQELKISFITEAVTGRLNIDQWKMKQATDIRPESRLA